MKGNIMAEFGNHSEFDGGGVMPNTVYPKGTDALTNSDKLRLQSLTGQETDSRAPIDPYFWQGNVARDEAPIKADAQARKQQERALRRAERDRYKESQY